MVNKKLKTKVIKFLSTVDGEKVTTVDELSAYFNLSQTDFLLQCTDKEVMDLLEKNKAVLRASMRRSWMASKNATLNLSVYKLMAPQDELARLNGEATEKTIKRKDPLLEVLDAEKVWNEE